MLLIRWQDWKFNRRVRRLKRDLDWFMVYVSEDRVTEADDRAIRSAEQVEEFLTNDWGIHA